MDSWHENKSINMWTYLDTNREHAMPPKLERGYIFCGTIIFYNSSECFVFWLLISFHAMHIMKLLSRHKKDTSIFRFLLCISSQFFNNFQLPFVSNCKRIWFRLYRSYRIVSTLIYSINKRKHSAIFMITVLCDSLCQREYKRYGNTP